MADEVTLPQPNILPTTNAQTVVSGQVGLEVALKPLQIGENQMAEVDTVQLSAEHGHIRREGAEHAADIRYDLATRAGDIRRELESGFADTRYNVAERAGDIRRELASGFDKTGDLVLGTSSDVRREGAEHTNEIVREQLKAEAAIRGQSAAQANEIVKEGLKGDFNTVSAIKDNRFDIITSLDRVVADLSKQVDAIDDTLTAQIINLTRDSVDTRTQVAGLGYQVRDGFVAAAKDMEINALKVQMDAAKNTNYLSDKIGMENEKTRDLINALKEQDLNRYLIERNAELVEERHHSRQWRANYDNAQFAALTSQLNAFQSQLAETRQGMVNFGTMAGVGQTSTANNVR